MLFIVHQWLLLCCIELVWRSFFVRAGLGDVRGRMGGTAASMRLGSAFGAPVTG